LRIGLKKPYSTDHVMKIVREIETEISTMTEETMEPSVERNEVEDLKGLAKDLANLRHDRLGTIGKFVHVTHHYLNISGMRPSDGLTEARDCYRRNPELYKEVRGYLADALLLITSLCSDWNRALET